jgi:hypothetical protein
MIYCGLLRICEELGDLRYLAVWRKLLKCWVDGRGETLIPRSDFKDPQLVTNPKVVPEDTSAADVVVEQLVRLVVRPDLDLRARLLDIYAQ